MLNLTKADILEYYSRKDVLNEIVRCSKDKEVAGNYDNKGYSKRPDTINYPQEIIDMVKQGVTSFHFSEETWQNVYNINSNCSKKQLNEMRKSWDLILDIDSKNFKVSQIASDLIIKAIKHHNIKSVTCKYSGNNGFHIAIPFQAFPKQIHNKETRTLFPQLPRNIAMYIDNMIREKLEEEIIKQFDLSVPSKLDEFSKSIGVELNELIINNKLDVEKAIKIDTIFLNSRHLCRMAYSFNEKSGLVSVPIENDQVLTFNKNQANAQNVIVRPNLFLNRENVIKDEAKSLLLQSMDFANSKLNQASIITNNIKEIKETRNYDESKFKETIRILPEAFPPCINNALKGINDGRKRALFVLMNFLSTAGHDFDEIKKMIDEWNTKNREPLRESYINGQLNYLKKVTKVPYNCINPIYKELDICKPDHLCQRIKNPIAYATRRHFYLVNKLEEETKEKEKEEQKRLKEEKKQQKIKEKEERKEQRRLKKIKKEEERKKKRKEKELKKQQKNQIKKDIKDNSDNQNSNTNQENRL